MASQSNPLFRSYFGTRAKRVTTTVSALVFITFASSIQAVEGDGLEEAIQLSVKKVYPAIVRIHVVAENGSGGRMKKSRGSGSGVIISKQGHVVTAAFTTDRNWKRRSWGQIP